MPLALVGLSFKWKNLHPINFHFLIKKGLTFLKNYPKHLFIGIADS